MPRERRCSKDLGTARGCSDELRVCAVQAEPRG